MSVLAQIDEIRASLTGPGQLFEIVDGPVRGQILPTYKNLPPNITHLFVKAAQDYADRTYMVMNDRRLTFAETFAQAASLAEVLKRDYGVGPGERVAIAARNTPDWVVAFFATILAGACGALINSRGAADEMLHAVHHTDCCLVIADARRAESIATGYAGPMLVSDDLGTFTDRKTGKAVELKPAALKITDAGPDDPAFILFTSGTTGRPKGAVLDHRGVYSCIFSFMMYGASIQAWTAKKMGVPVEQIAAAGAKNQSAVMAIFPFFHTSGAESMILGSLPTGGKMVMMDRWDTTKAIDLVVKERVTGLTLPPSSLWDLLAHPALETTDLSFVTSVGTGGQATPPNLYHAYNKAFPRAGGGGGYGQSETNGAICAARGDEYKPTAAGRIFNIAKVTIMDENGVEQPLGGVGEVCVKSVLVMSGYWNAPEANEAAFRNGWLRTGDIGFIDEDNYITIVDRKKDMIIRGGENIYCAELERVFHECPGVMECAAFGAPDDRYGEKVILAVVPHQGVDLSADAIAAHGKKHLADYKIPSEIEIGVEHLPRNTLGKVDRNILRKDYAARMA